MGEDRQKRQSRYTEQILEVIDDLAEAIAIYDEQDRLIFFNKAFLQVNPRAEEFVEKGLTYEDGIRMNVALGKVIAARGREEEFIRERVHAHQNPAGDITVRDYVDGSRLLVKEAKTANGGIALCITIATDLRKAEEELRQHEIELMRSKAEIEAALEENQRLSRSLAEKVKELEVLATTDPLTKLYNRTKLEEEMGREISRAARYGEAFGVIMMDIDHFKQVNDQFGHQTGDRVLAEVAKVLKHCSRATDVVGRWGGEEFLVVCPETDLAGLMAKAERFRQALEEYEFPGVGHKTSSFGIAAWRPGDAATDLLSRADAALYRAKESGRNRVEQAA
ncbi:MAG: diguanylate cyclase [Nisaea sp.]|uniref:sensor domain-containing diguanylate cyclase n=1 Tax=Nisaea sp. TaxID=2024842 RepID=UPI001B16EA9C|nr:sensor domain-containing diguanylate cyclase [Nisaea sp.]MBO6562745.1 diguanylate cyclase [Nisaea sp.]